jgi:fatty-acyl-CoA synthase
MTDSQHPHWPAHLARHLTIPETGLHDNLAVSARRYPDKPALIFYATALSYRQLAAEVELIAGWLWAQGVRPGDRVLLYLQNSPQFVIGYYAILRVNAVVVPVNPMNRRGELAQCLRDSGATIALAGQELRAEIEPLLGEGLRHLLLAAYSDHVADATQADLPDVVAAPRALVAHASVTAWCDALAAGLVASPVTAGSDDLAVLPYTSGTTGVPKGVMHTHRSVQATLVGGVQWFTTTQDAVCLATLPFFHVTGMQHSMNGPLYAGATIVLLTRWSREAALGAIERYRIDRWVAIPTMLIDFMSTPDLAQRDLRSLKVLFGGGAAMPEAVAQRLAAMGLVYIEGYGLTETIAQTHLNPAQRPKPQCLGIPVTDTQALIIDPDDLSIRPTGEVGEIVVRGPQVFQGYWRQPEATRSAFVDISGQAWFRTGDLGYVDAEGYFFMVDRLKRMINAAGFKVWPAEVEALLYRHPAIGEACVVGVRDARRGETVKAVVVLRESCRGTTSAADIIAWASGQMATYKMPRLVEFVDALPKTASGKILWRIVQEQQQRDST